MTLITIDEAIDWGRRGELCDLMTVDDQRQVAEWLAENAKLRATLKALMVGTHRELCADRHALQCRGCSMRGDDDKSCAVADAMELLGCDVWGNPMPEDTSDKR